MTIDTSREAVERLLDGVTPGPWQSDGEFMDRYHEVRVAMPDRCGVPMATIAEASHNWNDVTDVAERRISWKEAEANARFIAAARELVPALLARAEAAEAERDRAMQTCEQIAARAEAALAEVSRLTAERDEADRRAGAAERGWEADKETLATYRRHRDKLKEERGYNPNVSFDTVWKETCAKADAALILAPDTLRQVREAERDEAYAAFEKRQTVRSDGGHLQVNATYKSSFFEGWDAAIALLTKE